MRDDVDYISYKSYVRANEIDYIDAHFSQDITYSSGFQVDLTGTEPLLFKDVTYDNKIFKMEVRLIGKVAIVYPGGELKRLEKAINKKTKGKLKEMARRDNKTDEPLAFVRAHVFWAALFNLPECKVLIAKKVLENQAMAAVANLASSNVNAVRRVISLLKQELKWQRIKEVRLLIKR